MLKWKSKIVFFIAILITGFHCVFQDKEHHAMDWPEWTAESKPWTRWWWHGNSVTKLGITSELKSLYSKGFGGVELTPIFGVIGDESNFVDYLSPEWMDLFLFTLEEADRLGMQVDMATGTGWPFGGPWVSKSDASKYITYREYHIQEGQTLNQKIEYIQEPILRRVQNPAIDYFNTSKEINKSISALTPEDVEFFQVELEDIVQPIADNEDMQRMAFDQVRFEEPLDLVELIGFNNLGEHIFLLDSLTENNILTFKANNSDWHIIALFSGYHGKMVERAAPGGEGNVIDHFSTQAIKNYLAKFDEAFEGHNISALRAFFNDSYEVDDARGQANYTPELFEQFAVIKGYDIRAHIAAITNEDKSSSHTSRVIADYREVVSELLGSTFTKEWREWSHKHDALIRNQAHGSPANILDLYAASDIPEAEGTQELRIKFASSAGHVGGRNLIAAEAATWLDEHFLSDLSDLKQNIDRYLIHGVNHVVYHGTAYSPDEDEWPGRLFYAAIHANDRNPMWVHWDAFNHYVTRVQSILQSGKPNNDILLYYPAHDVLGTEGRELLKHFDGHGPEVDSSAFGRLAQELIDAGFTLDFISDKQMDGLQYDQGLYAGDLNYQVILVPATQFMPINTIQKLNDLAKQGTTIIFHSDGPVSVPGWKDYEEREQQLEEIFTQMEALPNVLVGEDIYPLLFQAGIQSESMAKQGLDFIRREIGEDSYYFVSNWSGEDFDDWIVLNQDNSNVILMDPMHAHIGLGKSSKVNNKTSLRLQLEQGASMIIKCTNADHEQNLWNYVNLESERIDLAGPWTVDFVSGGPELPESSIVDSPDFWTSWKEEELAYFSGIATYSTQFELAELNQDYLLDLGQVHETARVYINDQEVGTLVGPKYQILLPNAVLASTNSLRVEVANKMANRIIQMDRDRVFWKKFYNTNFPPRRLENRGRMGLFDASEWDIQPSGMSGPVTLRKLNNAE